MAARPSTALLVPNVLAGAAKVVLAQFAETVFEPDMQRLDLIVQIVEEKARGASPAGSVPGRGVTGSR